MNFLFELHFNVRWLNSNDSQNKVYPKVSWTCCWVFREIFVIFVRFHRTVITCDLVFHYNKSKFLCNRRINSIDIQCVEKKYCQRSTKILKTLQNECSSRRCTQIFIVLFCFCQQNHFNCRVSKHLERFEWLMPFVADGG